MSDLSDDEQDEIISRLAGGNEYVDEDEFQELYDQLDDDHKLQAENRLEDFANNAVGDEHWDSDD
jgi:hypothetical protein